MVKDKSRSSEKTQVLWDEYSGLIGDLSKKDTEIYVSDILENESISENWEKDLTLAFKE